MSVIINPRESFTETSLISGGSQNTTSVTPTLVNSSGVALEVATYEFFYIITYDAAATTTGALFTVNTSDTLVCGTLIGTVQGDCGSGDGDNRNIFGFGQGPAFASSRATSGNRGIIYMPYVRVTTAGTLVLYFATEVNASAITVTALTALYRRI